MGRDCDETRLRWANHRTRNISASHVGECHDEPRPPGYSDDDWAEVVALAAQGPGGYYGYTSGGLVFLNDNFFVSGDPNRMATYLMHELMHITNVRPQEEIDKYADNYAEINSKCGFSGRPPG
jgi:hypothetical protein